MAGLRFGTDLIIAQDWQPSPELKQSPSSMFYKPELAVISKRFDQLRESKDELALQRFIEQHRASALQRYNLRVRVRRRWLFTLPQFQVPHGCSHMGDRGPDREGHRR